MGVVKNIKINEIILVCLKTTNINKEKYTIQMICRKFLVQIPWSLRKILF